MDLEIEKSLVISTAHITDHDIDRLTEKQNAVVTHPYEYGWYVWTGGLETEEVCWEAKQHGFSEAFTGLLRLASENECSFVKIDRDGPVIDELENFHE